MSENTSPYIIRKTQISIDTDNEAFLGGGMMKKAICERINHQDADFVRCDETKHGAKIKMLGKNDALINSIYSFDVSVQENPYEITVEINEYIRETEIPDKISYIDKDNIYKPEFFENGFKSFIGLIIKFALFFLNGYIMSMALISLDGNIFDFENWITYLFYVCVAICIWRLIAFGLWIRDVFLHFAFRNDYIDEIAFAEKNNERAKKIDNQREIFWQDWEITYLKNAFDPGIYNIYMEFSRKVTEVIVSAIKSVLEHHNEAVLGKITEKSFTENEVRECVKTFLMI